MDVDVTSKHTALLASEMSFESEERDEVKVEIENSMENNNNNDNENDNDNENRSGSGREYNGNTSGSHTGLLGDAKVPHYDTTNSTFRVTSSEFCSQYKRKLVVQLTPELLTIQSQKAKHVYEIYDMIGAECRDHTILIHSYPEKPTGCCRKGLKAREHVEIPIVANEVPLARLWTVYLNRAIRRLSINADPLPDRSICIMVNPAAGTGDSINRLNTLRQMLKRSQLHHSIQVSTHAGHAYEIAQQLDINVVDSLVCLSGDGLIHEALNGLFSRSDWQTAIQRVSLGVIAGGSGNGLAKSVCYLSDEAYENINQLFIIIKNRKRPMDIATCAQPDQPIRFSFLSLSWAMISDIDLQSEKWRFLGGFRFTLAALIEILGMNRYEAELSILPSPDIPHTSKTSKRRRPLPTYPCCSATDDCDLCLKSHESNEVSQLAHFLQNQRNSEHELDSTHENWEVIKDKFTICWLSNVPWVGIDLYSSPMAHFSDGSMDLLFVRKCSRAGLFNAFLKIEDGRHLDSSVVEYEKVKGMRLVNTGGRECPFSLDGEPIAGTSVEMRVWRGIIKVFSE